MIIPLKFGKKKCLLNGAFFEEYVFISFYNTNKFIFVISIKTDRLSDLPHHKRLQLFHMSSPFPAVLSYFNLET